MGKKPARRRKTKVGLCILLLSLVTLAGAQHRGYFDHHYEFRKESEQLLHLLSSGEEGATSAYQQASVTFCEGRLLLSFVDRADRLTKTLGVFQGIDSVLDVENLNTIRGKTSRIEYELRYGDGLLTHGEISYLQDKGGAWRLLGYSIGVPRRLASLAKSVDSEKQRLVAPLEVRTLLRSILDETSQGMGSRIRKNASPPFQESISEAQFEKVLVALDRDLGPFQEILEIRKSAHNAAKTRAKITAILQYKKGRTTGTFEFIKVESEQQWRLLHFKVLIPEPLLPPRLGGVSE